MQLNTKLRLVPWDWEVSFANRLLAFDVSDGGLRTSKAETPSEIVEGEISNVGLYARFAEGMFVFYCDAAGQFFIGWRANATPLVVRY